MEVYVLGRERSRGRGQLKYHTSPDCRMPRKHGYETMELGEAVRLGYTPCRAFGPCRSMTKAGPSPGHDHSLATGQPT